MLLNASILQSLLAFMLYCKLFLMYFHFNIETHVQNTTSAASCNLLPQTSITETPSIPYPLSLFRLEVLVSVELFLYWYLIFNLYFHLSICGRAVMSTERKYAIRKLKYVVIIISVALLQTM